jgi:membrane protease YdiL (CAAX protease family)
MSTNTLSSEKLKKTGVYKLAGIIWLLTLFVLTFSGWISQFMQQHNYTNPQFRSLLQGIIMSGIIVSTIYIISKKYTEQIKNGIGFMAIAKALKHFIIGISFILLPFILTLLFTVLFGWGDIVINNDGSLFTYIFFGSLSVFLFEALPEEMAFRGYIYTKLNTILDYKKASVLTVLLFTLLPIIVFVIQRYLLGMEAGMNASNSFQPSFIITLLVFASFLQFLRILTGSIWVGIGFHFGFVYIDRLIGISDSDLFQMVNMTNEAGPQIMLLSCIAVVILILIVYTVRKKKKSTQNVVLA